MKRFTILIALALFLGAPLAVAQTPPPAQKAKFVAPVKGVATIDVQRAPSKRSGKEILTVLKVKNTSKGSINLLSADQFWYDRTSKQVSFGDYRHRKAPIQPGEVIEFTITAPNNPQISHDAIVFKHANGTIQANQVKKIQ